MTCSTPCFAAVALLLFAAACDPVVGGDEGGSTTDDGTTTGEPPATSTSFDPSTSSTSVATSDTSTTLEPGTSSTTSEEEGSSSSSTGEPGDCVDEDIGGAVGEAVVSAMNDGQGDDFSLRFCDGGFGSTTTGADTGDPTGMTSGVTSDGDTTGEAGDGEDYVVSWTPPSSGPFTIDTFGSGIDTVLSVVPPACGASPQECNDDCIGLESGLVFEASKGQTVFIVIEGYGGRQGEFVLNIAEGGTLECGVGTTGDTEDTGMTTAMTTSP